MTLNEAIALQPAWVGWWLNWLLIGAFLAPVALLFWKPSRIAGIVSLLASILAAVGVGVMYEQLGYVKLLGLPHVLIWTPLAYYLWIQIKRADLPAWPRRIIWVIFVTILISLAFDYTDLARYLLGERTPLAMPA